MPKKSIYRQSGAQHFQLVHRSQRDPLIHDSEVSQHVLKPFERANVCKGRTREDLEGALTPEEMQAVTGRANVGQASLYDIFYDDTDYDYMQHLRQISVDQGQEEDVETIMIPAPAPKQSKGETRARGTASFLKEVASDIPLEALPSATEISRDYEAGAAIPPAIAGFQPDMDFHLRQVLEALEDDAFVDDGLGDDFFGELFKGGERGDDEHVHFESNDDGEYGLSLERLGLMQEASAGKSWVEQFSHFKLGNARASTSECGDDDSEGKDTMTGLPKLSVVSGRRRWKGASDASGYSLTSSSMFRNKGLSTLDEQFAKIEEEYAPSDEDDMSENADSDSGGEVPNLQTRREDFGSLLEEFLAKNEIAAGRLLPVLPGSSGTEKLGTLRRAMTGETRVNSLEVPEVTMKQAVVSLQGISSNDEESDEDIPIPAIVGIGTTKDRWDVETILSTYTNLDNHPRLIRARSDRSEESSAAQDSKPVHVRLDSRTGLPRTPALDAVQQREQSFAKGEKRMAAIGRPRGETVEEKQARKRAVKNQREARRVEKQRARETFSNERNHQVKAQETKQNIIRKL